MRFLCRWGYHNWSRWRGTDNLLTETRYDEFTQKMFTVAIYGVQSRECLGCSIIETRRVADVKINVGEK